MPINGRQVGKICDLQHSSGHIAMQNCIHSRPAEQMKTRWVAPFQITHWHAPRMCTAWGCSLTVNLGPHGLLNVKTGARTRDLSDSVIAPSDSVIDHVCKPMQPRARLVVPTNACKWQPWVNLMLGQSQMHTDCSKTIRELSKCTQIAQNVVTLFPIEKSVTT